MRLLGVALALSAVSILVYTGAEVMVLRSRPLWHTVFLPVNFALTAWLGALGAMFLVARWLPGGLKALPVDMLRQLSLSAVVLMALGAGPGPCWACWAWTRRSSRAAPVPRIPDLAHQPGRRGRHGLLHRRPAAEAGPRAGHAAGLGRAGADHAGGGLDLPLGGVHERAGRAEVWRRLYLYDMPWGSDGLLGMAGVLGRGAGRGGDLRAGPVPGPRPRRVEPAAARIEERVAMDKQHEDDKTGKPGMAQDAPESTQEQPRDEARRKLMLRGGVVAGGMAAFAAGYGETVVKAVKGLAQGTAGAPTAHAVRGNSLTPEFRIDPVSGVLSAQPGQTVSPSSCLGCWTQCGVRLRVDAKENRILRVAGNPYHPLATTRPAAMETPVREVYAQLGGDNGLEGRATSCARGSAMLEQLHSPYRVLQPLKRVGPRGAGKWQTISFEQLVQEVCEGGDLFGEGHVDGLRAIYDRETPLDPANPEYGAKVNQFLFTDASNEGRTPLIQRFAGQSFGTVNFGNHGSYCGQSFRVGAGAALGDLKGMPHGKPDWDNARFGLFIGAAPAQAGNPFQRQRGSWPRRARGRRKRASSMWWCRPCCRLVQPVGRFGQ